MDEIKVATINCRGQTRLTNAKQLQIQHFVHEYNIDIAFLQETNFTLKTFDNWQEENSFATFAFSYSLWTFLKESYHPWL